MTLVPRLRNPAQIMLWFSKKTLAGYSKLIVAYILIQDFPKVAYSIEQFTSDGYDSYLDSIV